MTTQHDCQTLLLRQCRDGFVESLLQFILLREVIRRWCGVVGILALRTILMIVVIFQSHLFTATAATRLIEDKIAHDREQPRRELRRRFIAWSALPHTQKHLLGDVMRIFDIPQHSRRSADHDALMQLHESFKGLHITLLHQQHQPDVLRIA